MKYRATFKTKGKLANGPIWESEQSAQADAREAVKNGATYAAILRDSEGSDHPSNAGKFFLHRYIKA
jgi:hypothetical protein